MCLSVPVKVISVNKDKALVSIGGAETTVSLGLLEGVKEGDYLIVHTGIALQILSEVEAKEMIDLIAACNE